MATLEYAFFGKNSSDSNLKKYYVVFQTGYSFSRLKIMFGENKMDRSLENLLMEDRGKRKEAYS